MKKILFSAIMATTLSFANTANHHYEVTPTLGGVLPEGNLDLGTHLTYGLRLGINLESTVFHQFEVGYDHSSGVDYDVSSFETSFNRYYGNLVKEYKMTPESALYALIGVGYEDVKNEQFDNKDSMFAQYGGGVKYWMNENFALKAEVRHAFKAHNGDNNLFYSLGFVIPLDAKAKPAVGEAPKPTSLLATKIVDTDNDGVYDDKDKCSNTPKNTVVDEFGCPKIIRLHVGFDFDQSVIKSEYMTEIAKVADFMKQNSGYSVILEGHTDAKGSEAYNQKLSEKRVKAVAKALADLGIGEAKITTEAYGEMQPISTNDTEAGRAENRRVDALFKK
ncbi:MAG: OmpA family protein [Sulfurospirillaceae bacterium]|nr:OmpA family protein [Sulfurospirillaceae bacterium]